MAPWTEKLTLESAMQVRRWAVSAIECSVNPTPAYLRNWRSTMPWFFPLSSMVLRRGHCIQAYLETGALPHESSPLHPGDQVAGPHHQSRGPRSSLVHQHRGHHHQGPTSIGWTRDWNGGVSDAETTPDVRGTSGLQKKSW